MAAARSDDGAPMPRTGHGCLTKTSPPEGADSYELGYFNALRTGIPVAPLTTRQRVHREARSMYERMLVPLDGSGGAYVDPMASEPVARFANPSRPGSPADR